MYSTVRPLAYVNNLPWVAPLSTGSQALGASARAGLDVSWNLHGYGPAFNARRVPRKGAFHVSNIDSLMTRLNARYPTLCSLRHRGHFRPSNESHPIPLCCRPKTGGNLVNIPICSMCSIAMLSSFVNILIAILDQHSYRTYRVKRQRTLINVVIDLTHRSIRPSQNMALQHIDNAGCPSRCSCTINVHTYMNGEWRMVGVLQEIDYTSVESCRYEVNVHCCLNQYMIK